MWDGDVKRKWEHLYDRVNKGDPGVPLLSREGDAICLSAVPPQQETTDSIWDRVLEIKAPEPHNVSSDWWCLTFDGSEDPVQVTDLGAISPHGDFGVDGNHLAFIATDGEYVMKTNGNDLRKIKEVNAFGTLDWVP
jgi:hypothetical protein